MLHITEKYWVQMKAEIQKQLPKPKLPAIQLTYLANNNIEHPLNF